jgi:hypothetical protein
MRTTFKVSLVLNGLLLVGSAVLAVRSTSNRSAVPQPAPGIAKSVAVPMVSTSAPPSVQPTSATAPVPFRWQQLDASDYHIYVKNLRGIGCPEPSVRAIVMADVHAVFQIHARQIQKQLAALANDSWSAQLTNHNSSQALNVELSRLPAQEAAAVADLLGLPAPGSQVADDAHDVDDASADDQGEAAKEDSVPVPLVLQDIDPKDLGLDDEQVEELNRVRETFTRQVGGTNQDPADPAYLARWQYARLGADTMYRSILGSDGYTRYLILENKRALLATQRAAEASGQAGVVRNE